MSSNSSSNYIESILSGASIKNLLLFELKKIKKRLDETPHPYCELDCPWLSFCRRLQGKHSLIGCILSDLIDSRLWSNLNAKSSEIIVE